MVDRPELKPPGPGSTPGTGGARRSPSGVWQFHSLCSVRCGLAGCIGVITAAIWLRPVVPFALTIVTGIHGPRYEVTWQEVNRHTCFGGAQAKHRFRCCGPVSPRPTIARITGILGALDASTTEGGARRSSRGCAAADRLRRRWRRASETWCLLFSGDLRLRRAHRLWLADREEGTLGFRWNVLWRPVLNSGTSGRRTDGRQRCHCSPRPSARAVDRRGPPAPRNSCTLQYRRAQIRREHSPPASSDQLARSRRGILHGAGASSISRGGGVFAAAGSFSAAGGRSRPLGVPPRRQRLGRECSPCNGTVAMLSSGFARWFWAKTIADPGGAAWGLELLGVHVRDWSSRSSCCLHRIGELRGSALPRIFGRICWPR